MFDKIYDSWLYKKFKTLQSEMSIFSNHSMCPKTGLWLDNNNALLFQDKEKKKNLGDIAFPVMIKDDSEHVYELSDLVSFKFCASDVGMVVDPQLQIKSNFRLEELVPVRYPGFKDYIETICMLQLLTSGGWEGAIHDGGPDLIHGISLSLPRDDWQHSDLTALQRRILHKLIFDKWNHESSHSEDVSTLASQLHKIRDSHSSVNVSDMFLLGGTLGVIGAAFLLGKQWGQSRARASGQDK